MCIFIQTSFNKVYDIVCEYGGRSGVVLAFLWNMITIPVLLDSVAGDMERCGNLPLAHTFKTHLTNLFVHFHCDNHLYTPPL